MVSCKPANNKLEYALKASSSNRKELERVLSHYQDDSLKLEAAVFLIENMPGHFRYPPELDKIYKPLYDKHALISEKYNWEKPAAWRDEIDSLWKHDKNKYSLPKLQQDIFTLSADWLIREIDLAFKSWKENGYTKGCSFETFCQSILPYRMLNGIIADDCRSIIYERHRNFFQDTVLPFRDKIDSLLIQYASLKHNDYSAVSTPIYSAQTFEHIKRGLCDVKAWYNTLLLSSLGMAVTYDFIPAWGNRSNAHGWNAVIMDGETHPFEPFWDDDRWKYKRIYNNKDIDFLWGKFRLPKVYRHTFESYIEGPNADKRVEVNDIPPFFRNIFMKDVSSEYFEATDITIPIQKPTDRDMYYCYLCVFQASGFSPVQWGKIEKGRATFKGMGHEIVYFPMYYSNGHFIPAANPFLINENGQYREMKRQEENKPVNVRMINTFLGNDEIQEARDLIKGAFLIGYNEEFKDRIDTLIYLNDSLHAFKTHFSLSSPGRHRYLKLINLPDTTGLSEIYCYELQNEKPLRIPNIKTTASITSLKEEEYLDLITDRLSATGFKGYFNGNSREITFDLGTEYLLGAIDIEPYLESTLSSTASFELFYWDDKWISAGIKQGNDNCLTFDSVPQGTVYQLRRPNWNNIRIFTNNDGQIEWY